MITPQEFVPAAAYVAGASAWQSIPTATNLMITLNVTATAGGGTATFVLEVSDDGGVTSYPYSPDFRVTTGGAYTGADGKVAAPTAAGKFLAAFRGIAANKFRLVWTFATMTSITFSARMSVK